MSTITADLAERFPACPTFGFISEPGILVKITSREGGYERRDRKWSRSLRKYTGVPMGDQKEDEILDILDFWEAMGGMHSGFRFKDWFDFKSCRRNVTPTPRDQPLVVSGANFRLAKLYPTKTGRTVQQREIFRPIGATVLIANEVGVTQTDWTLNESTGILTKGAGFSGVPTSWGGEFDVWCRFDAQFNPSISNYKAMSVTIQLAEIRVPL